MKSIRMIVAAAAALLLAGSAAAQTNNEVIAKYNEAAGLIQKKQYAEAITALNQTIEMGLAAGGDAVTTVQQAQKLLPACYFRKGLGFAQQGKFEDAIVEFGTAIETGQLYGDASSVRNAQDFLAKSYIALGADAFNSKDYPKAAEIFAKGYAINPNNTDLAMNLAMSYCEMGDYAQGVPIYENVIALGDKHSRFQAAADEAREKLSYYLILAASNAAAEGKADEAYAYIDQLLTIEPQDAEANMLRLQLATNNQAWDKIIEWGEAAAEAQTDPALKSDAYFLLGAAYQNKENKAKAIETYRKVTSGSHAATAREQIELLSK